MRGHNTLVESQNACSSSFSPCTVWVQGSDSGGLPCHKSQDKCPLCPIKPTPALWSRLIALAQILNTDWIGVTRMGTPALILVEKEKLWGFQCLFIMLGWICISTLCYVPSVLTYLSEKSLEVCQRPFLQLYGIRLEVYVVFSTSWPAYAVPVLVPIWDEVRWVRVFILLDVFALILLRTSVCGGCFGCQLDTPVKRELLLRNRLHLIGQWTLTVGCFLELLINVPEPSPLWVVPSVNRWSWAVRGPYESQKQSVPCGLCCSCLPKPHLPTLVSGSD